MAFGSRRILIWLIPLAPILMLIGPARAETNEVDVPPELSECGAIFQPTGVPRGWDGADEKTFVFANGTVPQAPDPPTILRCHAAAFALRLNGITKVPDWVAEDLTPDEIAGGASRRDRFFVGQGEEAYSANLADYRGSGFDRGHQAPSANFSGDQVKQDESFVLSNIGPQVGRCFNQGVWRELETAVRNLMATRERLIVFTGPIYSGPLRTIADIRKARGGSAAASLPGEGVGAVAVPDAFFKIVYDPAMAQAMAFRLPNQTLCHRAPDDEEFRTSIDAIEEETGFEFLTALPDRTHNMLRAQVSLFWNW